MGDMYDYIFESSTAVQSIVKNQDVILNDCAEYLIEHHFKSLYLVGSGTSYNAALGVKKVMQSVLRRTVTVMHSMEFVDTEYLNGAETAVIGVSQGGRSKSTIEALHKARKAGAITLSMTSDLICPVASAAEVNIQLDVGIEDTGPKTKGYFGTMAELTLLALKIAEKEFLITKEDKDSIQSEMLKSSDSIKEIGLTAEDWYFNNREQLLSAHRIIVIGYDNVLSAESEGALKILEGLRCCVDGFEMEEFMHGIYHAIDNQTWIFALAPEGRHRERLIRLLDYLEKRKGSHNFVITSDTHNTYSNALKYPFHDSVYFASFEYVVPLQIIARLLSEEQGIDCNENDSPDFHRMMQSYKY